MGAANVGPEFTISEYIALEEIEKIEQKLYEENRIAMLSKMTDTIKQLVIASGRWKKWLRGSESQDDFSLISDDRQRWLIQTGARYVWQEPEAISARRTLYDNLADNGIDAEEIVLSSIEKDIDKYYRAFNLINLNNYLK